LFENWDPTELRDEVRTTWMVRFTQTGQDINLERSQVTNVRDTVDNNDLVACRQLRNAKKNNEKFERRTQSHINVDIK